MFRIWPPEDSGGAGGVGVGRPIVVILMEYITNVRSRIGDGISNLSDALEQVVELSIELRSEIVRVCLKAMDENLCASKQERAADGWQIHQRGVHREIYK